jgi:hypothetical protein
MEKRRTENCVFLDLYLSSFCIFVFKVCPLIKHYLCVHLDRRFPNISRSIAIVLFLAIVGALARRVVKSSTFLTPGMSSSQCTFFTAILFQLNSQERNGFHSSQPQRSVSSCWLLIQARRLRSEPPYDCATALEIPTHTCSSRFLVSSRRYPYRN